MRSVVVAPLGPYPAPLAQLLWALHRQRDLEVSEVFALVDARGRRYLEQDFLRPGSALDQLRAALGPTLVDRARFHVIEASEDEPAAFNRTLWDVTRDAVRAAGNDPLVFGLIGGTRRSVIALETAYFQLLARPQDLLVDVRASDPRVAESSQFLFPEQAERVVVRGGATIIARAVEIVLTDLEIPRLGALVADPSLGTYESAQQATQKAIDRASPPELEVDLTKGRARVDGEILALSAAELVWYAHLAVARAAGGEGWVLAGQEGHAALRAFVRGIGAQAWIEDIRTRPLLELLASDDWVDDDDLRNVRGKTVQKLKKWCAEHQAAKLLVPEVDGRHRQRIALPGSRIRILRR